MSLKQEPNNEVAPIRPELAIGISIHNPVIDEESELTLIERASHKGAQCDACGVSINKEMRKSIHYKGMWFNACPMCFYTQNIDQIPHFLKGSIIYFPKMSQARLNAFLRGLWSINYMAKLDPENEELLEMCSSFEELDGLMSGQKQVTEGYFGTSQPDVISSMLNLLTDVEYNQRHKLLTSFRWMPTMRTFEDEMGHWAQESYHELHPEKISGNITKFVSKFIPTLKINE